MSGVKRIEGWRVPWALLLAVAAVAIAVTGCGGGSEDSGLESGAIETSSITKEEFIKQADEICELGNRWMLKQIAAYMAEREGESSNRESPGKVFTAAAKAVALPRVEANVRDIQALGAPSGDETELEAFLVQAQQETVSLQGQREISMDELFGHGFNNAGELARNYGIGSCAYG